MRVKTMRFLFCVAAVLVSMTSLSYAAAPADNTTKPDSLYIRFQYESSRLDLNYMSNGKNINTVFRQLDKLGPRMVKSVKLVGYTSPEGFYGHNMDLSRQMVSSVSTYLKNEYPIFEYRIASLSEGEAWDQLLALVEKDQALSPTSKLKIIEIIEGPKSFDEKKASLKEKLGKDDAVGDVYNYLQSFYFPRLRYVLVTFEYYPEMPKDVTGRR